jgi:Asp-tRNA(Asn)/Glu-tRNA(Gln) amidotransferase A subunit family amidase
MVSAIRLRLADTPSCLTWWIILQESSLSPKSIPARNYQVEKMAGLPVGIQIIGRRLEEEWTLKGMELVEESLHKIGVRYEG